MILIHKLQVGRLSVAWVKVQAWTSLIHHMMTAEDVVDQELVDVDQKLVERALTSDAKIFHLTFLDTYRVRD